MFAKDNLLPRDSVFTQVAYYACLSAIRIGDYREGVYMMKYNEIKVCPQEDLY